VHLAAAAATAAAGAATAQPDAQSYWRACTASALQGSHWDWEPGMVYRPRQQTID
jgi:hypothetical protein